MPMHKEFRQQWVKAGYSSKMGSAEVVLPPSSSVVRVYHITSAEYGISNLGLRRIKVARFMDLNDPYELLALRVTDKPTKRRLAEFKTTYDSNVGLLSFSSNWTNSVLWSHYGSKHRGICLGFDLTRSVAIKVHYENERVRAALDNSEVSGEIPDSLRTQLLCTKFDHWRYEEEIRVSVPLDRAGIRKEGSLYFYPFGGDLELREVILGQQCTIPLEDVRRLVNATYTGVTAIKARLADKSFGVVPQETTVP